jgi:hypothetical protein
MFVDFRLFNFGIGVHLLQAEDPEGMPPKKTEIDPKDNHISFTVSPHAHLNSKVTPVATPASGVIFNVQASGEKGKLDSGHCETWAGCHVSEM